MKRILMVSFLILSFESSNAQSSERQLHDSIGIVKDQHMKFGLMVKLAYLVQKHSYDTGMLIANESLTIAKSINDDKTLGSAFKLLANIYERQGKWSDVIINDQMALEYYKKRNDSLMQFKALQRIGLSYRQIGDFKKALEYYFKAMEISMALNDKHLTGSISTDLAILFSDIGEVTLNFKYYENALAIFEEMKDTTLIVLGLNNIADSYRLNNQKKKFEECVLRALELTEKSNVTSRFSMTYDNVATMWAERGDYQKALIYYLKSLEAERKSGDKPTLIYQLKNVSSFCIKSKDYQGALRYAKEGLILSVQEQSIGLKEGLTRNLSIAYEKLYQFEKSLHFLKMADSLNSKMHAIDNQKGASNMAARYELNKKEQQEKLEQEKQLAALSRHNNLEFLIIASFVTGIFIFLFSIRGRMTPKRLDMLTFVAFMLLFEFAIVLFEPKIQNITRNEPFLILLGNVLIALIIAPIHSIVERKFKTILVKHQR